MEAGFIAPATDKKKPIQVTKSMSSGDVRERELAP